MSGKTIHCEKRGPAVWITLDRPEAMNSLSPGLLDELEAAIDSIEDDPAVRVVVLTGAGRAFCAGADLSFVFEALERGEGPAELASFIKRAAAVLGRLESLPKPVIAGVNGLALAGGLEIILCCDLVVAAESARLGDGHANYGLLPGAGGAARLVRKVGPSRAKQLLFTGDLLVAGDLEASGLVNSVVPDEELIGAIDKLVAKIAQKSPLGLAAMKQLVGDALEQPLAIALRSEQKALEAHLHSYDVREGLSAFREKRAPHFEGR